MTNRILAYEPQKHHASIVNLRVNFQMKKKDKSQGLKPDSSVIILMTDRDMIKDLCHFFFYLIGKRMSTRHSHGE